MATYTYGAITPLTSGDVEPQEVVGSGGMAGSYLYIDVGGTWQAIAASGTINVYDVSITGGSGIGGSGTGGSGTGGSGTGGSGTDGSGAGGAGIGGAGTGGSGTGGSVYVYLTGLPASASDPASTGAAAASSTGSGAGDPTGSTGAGSGADTPAGAAAIDRAVTFERGIFTLTGHASSPAGVASVEISALVDGVATDLGAATVNADGTFSFSDLVGRHTQGFITATVTDGTGAEATSADPGFSLTGGLRGPGGTTARQTLYTADGSAETAVDLFTPGGSQRDTIKAPGQTVTSAYADRFNDGGQPETTFVFDPGHGTDVVNLFRVDGSDHDTLSLSGSDYGNSVADVLRHTFQTKAGDAVIYDPAAGDAVRLTGITKAQLAANQGDIAFHA